MLSNESSRHIEMAREAEKLQDLLNKLLTEGATDNVPDQAVQQLMTTAVKLYASKREAGAQFSPFVGDDSVTTTEVLTTVTKMLSAVDVELFELGMWQLWGNR